MDRILIVKPSSMGDVLHAFPAVRTLLVRDNPPAVDWVIRPAFAELLDYLPGIRRKILFRRRELGNLWTFFLAFRELLRELRQERYDAVIDLQGLLRSALIARLARSARVCGPASAREWPAKSCYSRLLRFPRTVRHAVERNCAMIGDFCGKACAPAPYRLPTVEKYRRRAEHLLAEAGITPDARFIAIAPGARWPTKQWPPEFFAATAKRIAAGQPGRAFVLLGSPGEKEAGNTIIRAADGLRITNLCGRTSTGELVEVIRRADLLLGNDSGPMHVAAAAGTATAALFGPTDPALTGPYGGNCRIIRPNLDCLNCFRKHCRPAKCHNSIAPHLMAETVMELLNQGNKCQ